MKDFRHTLIDYKLYYPIHRLHLVSQARAKVIHFYLFILLLLSVKLIKPIYFYLTHNTHTHLRVEKKPPLKTFDDVQALISQGKKRELKLLLRENAWPINSTIRAQLWPAICSQHQVGKSMLEGYYWDMVNQVHKQKKTFYRFSI